MSDKHEVPDEYKGPYAFAAAKLAGKQRATGWQYGGVQSTMRSTETNVAALEAFILEKSSQQETGRRRIIFSITQISEITEKRLQLATRIAGKIHMNRQFTFAEMMKIVELQEAINKTERERGDS